LDIRSVFLIKTLLMSDSDHISQICLITKDLDQLVCSYLEPPCVLTMTEVSVHYRDCLSEKQQDFNSTKTDFKLMCNHSWIIKWAIRSAMDFDQICKALAKSNPFIHSDLTSSPIPSLHSHDEWAFRVACKSGDIDLARWLIARGEESDSKINIHIENELPFCLACHSGHIDLPKWLIAIGEASYGKIDIHAKMEGAFRNACLGGRKETAEWLISIGEESYGKVNINCDNFIAFRGACHHNHRDIVKWLIAIGLCKSIADKQRCFQYACKCGNKEIAEWLISLEGVREKFTIEFAISISNGEIVDWLKTL